jgi:hypothetical protein
MDIVDRINPLGLVWVLFHPLTIPDVGIKNALSIGQDVHKIKVMAVGRERGFTENLNRNKCSNRPQKTQPAMLRVAGFNRRP